VDDTTHWFMFIAGVLVLLSATVFGRNINRLVRRSIEVRYRNEDLIRALSEQKALAEAARAQAEHADRAKSQFLAAASHDLRQPLHALGLFGAALETRTRDPEAKALVTSINQSVEALETLFNELLDISRLDAGAIQPALAHFPLRPLLNRIRLDFSAPAQQKQLRFVVHDSALWVHSDALLLERMLRNFVANAVRYTHRGGVLVACRRRGSQVSVEIWDTGIGFAADQRELIFEEFYQVGDTGRHTKKGLGLGLAIARRLALLLGYRIEVRSEPRRGSVFGLRVPLGDAHAATAAPAEQPVVASPLAQGKLILVVDDETPILDGMHALLSTWGCEVVTGASGDEALDALGELERYPDLIIADYRLQRKETGIDVIRRVREELGVLLPAILITGTTTGDLASAVENIGCDLLYKPVLPQELQATIAGKLGLG
jgi:signal transduction histidine kinase